MVNSLNPNQGPQNVKELVNPYDDYLSTFHLDFKNIGDWYRSIHIVQSKLKVYDAIIDVPPDEPSTLSDYDSHKKYADWMRSDYLARHCILKTMPDDLKLRYVNLRSTYEIWERIKRDSFDHLRSLQEERVNMICSSPFNIFE